MVDDSQGPRGIRSGAELLADFLQRNSVSQVAAAEAIGVSGPTVYDWVAGKKRPKTHHREAIALWTNGEVPVDTWLEDHERATVADVRPFVPADESGEHPAVSEPHSGTG